eukprot:2314149-Rhodomonas_salina.1
MPTFVACDKPPPHCNWHCLLHCLMRVHATTIYVDCMPSSYTLAYILNGADASPRSKASLRAAAK